MLGAIFLLSQCDVIARQPRAMLHYRQMAFIYVFFTKSVIEYI